LGFDLGVHEVLARLLLLADEHEQACHEVEVAQLLVEVLEEVFSWSSLFSWSDTELKLLILLK
jgi:hypothetical protein